MKNKFLNLRYIIYILLLVFFRAEVISQEYLYDETAFIHYLKYFDVDLNKYAVAYLRSFKPEVYNAILNDEFEYETKRRETVKFLEEKVKQIQKDNKYYINTTAKLGKYNFERKSFEFFPVKKTTYFKLLTFLGNENISFPTDQINLNFSNSGIIKELPLEPEKAKKFIEERKTQEGDVDRTVYLRIIFSIIGPSPDIKNSLLAKIHSLQVYDDEYREKLLYEYVFADQDIKLDKSKKDNKKIVTSKDLAISDLENILRVREIPLDMKRDIEKIIMKYQSKEKDKDESKDDE